MVLMRWKGLAVLLLLVAGAFAGCLGDERTSDKQAPHALDLGAIAAGGASIAKKGDGALLSWLGPLTLEAPIEFVIPAGVTRVDATLTNGPSIAFRNGLTDRPRCVPEYVTGWLTSNRDVARCSGLTVLDPLPTTWKSSLRTLRADQKLEVVLSTDPLDGQAALIKLENLAMPTFAQTKTQVHKVVSSLDGSKIHVEVTVPDAAGPFPTILVSSPYNHATRLAGLRVENNTIANWVPRGYAVVTADVRGFGLSEGCVDVWGRYEQQDQVDVVEWVARQPWSDGKVGFYGQSYVGTTPVEAASLAAPHLTTIVTIAPVINAYEDWHFGGVPNGENTGSPSSYQSLGSEPFLPSASNPGPPSPERLMLYANGQCNTDLLIRGKVGDPRSVYDDFYRERDFKKKATDIKASVFYTQGWYDTNVKSQMIPGWFDKITAPKKALFGDWIHQHPPRADQELLFHAWFDHWLMGRDTGIDKTPVVEVKTNSDTVRVADNWPPTETTEVRFGADLSGLKLVEGSGAGSTILLAQSASDRAPLPASPLGVPSVKLEGAPLAERLYLSGQLQLGLRASLRGAPNTYFYAQLRDVAPEGASKIVSFGMLNAALRDGYDTYKPVPPDTTIDYKLPFLVTEYVVEAGHRLQLVIRTKDNADWSGGHSTQPGQITLYGSGTTLLLPTLAEPGDVPAPRAAFPVADASP